MQIYIAEKLVFFLTLIIFASHEEQLFFEFVFCLENNDNPK